MDMNMLASLLATDGSWVLTVVRVVSESLCSLTGHKNFWIGLAVTASAPQYGVLYPV
jgi:hypothetical protein